MATLITLLCYLEPSLLPDRNPQEGLGPSQTAHQIFYKRTWSHLGAAQRNDAASEHEHWVWHGQPRGRTDAALVEDTTHCCGLGWEDFW